MRVTSPDSAAYRWFLRAMAFFVVVHVLALATMGTMLMPGLGADNGSAILERATYIAENRWVWWWGWLPWRLSALSDVAVSVALIAWARRRGGLGWAVLSLILTFVAAVPEQWAEWRMVGLQVEAAERLIAGGSSVAQYAAMETSHLLITGTWGGGWYIAMTAAWMATLRAAHHRVGPSKSSEHLARRWWTEGPGAWPIGWSAALLAAFAIAVAAHTFAQLAFQPQAATWHMVAGVFNGIAFPGLVIWSIYFTGWLGELERRARGLSGCTARWALPRKFTFVARIVEPLALWDGVRDLTRVLMRPMPFIRMASQIEDVVYLSWMVPVERVAHLVEAPLELEVRNGMTPVSVLTYRHGNFGPAAAGPLRRLLPSPVQANWRVYLKPTETVAAGGIAFFTNGIDAPMYAIGARVTADGLPVELWADARHVREGREVTTEVTAGDGTAPDLQCTVREHESHEVPRAFADAFGPWPESVRYVVEQNRGERLHPAVGLASTSSIHIPIEIDEVRPALVKALASTNMAWLFEGCETFAFVVPAVDFRATGESHRSLGPSS